MQFFFLFLGKWCVVLYFINNLGFLFIFYLFFKYEGYFISGCGFNFKFFMDWFELYSYVIFSVEDLIRNKFFLNGGLIFLELMVLGCFVFWDVYVIFV